MITSFARVPTGNAKEYLSSLRVLARGFGFRDAGDGAHAVIQVRRGICEFGASDSFLDISITASSISDAATLEDVVADRLDGIASEELRYHWVMAPDARREPVVGFSAAPAKTYRT